MSKKCAISLCKCQTTKNNFGIRLENTIKKIDNQDIPVWETTWAYKIKSDTDIQNFADTSNQEMEGNFLISDFYPGCPYCGKKKIILCGECNRLLCFDDNQTTVICPWDNKPLMIQRGAATRVRGHTDR